MKVVNVREDGFRALSSLSNNNPSWNAISEVPAAIRAIGVSIFSSVSFFIKLNFCFSRPADLS